MTDKTLDENSAKDRRDWSKTLNLPQTEFPMRAGLPKKEPEIIARWEEMDLYATLARAMPKGRRNIRAA